MRFTSSVRADYVAQHQQPCKQQLSVSLSSLPETWGAEAASASALRPCKPSMAHWKVMCVCAQASLSSHTGENDVTFVIQARQRAPTTAWRWVIVWNLNQALHLAEFKVEPRACGCHSSFIHICWHHTWSRLSFLFFHPNIAALLSQQRFTQFKDLMWTGLSKMNESILIKVNIRAGIG